MSLATVFELNFAITEYLEILQRQKTADEPHASSATRAALKDRIMALKRKAFKEMHELDKAIAVAGQLLSEHEGVFVDV